MTLSAIDEIANVKAMLDVASDAVNSSTFTSQKALAELLYFNGFLVLERNLDVISQERREAREKITKLNHEIATLDSRIIALEEALKKANSRKRKTKGKK